MKFKPALLVTTLFSLALFANAGLAQSTFSSPMITAQATSAKESSKASKPKKEKKAKAQKGGGVTFYEGSGETRAERDKRLTRECRGRSNAGLCEGYARQ